MRFSMSNRSAARLAKWPPVDAFQRLGVAAHDPADGVLGASGPGRGSRSSISALQRGVVDHQGVGAEDGAILPAELVGDGLLVVAGPRGPRPQAPDAGAPALLPGPCVSTKRLGNAEPFRVQHQGRSDGHAGRNGDAAFDFHEGSGAGQRETTPDLAVYPLGGRIPSSADGAAIKSASASRAAAHPCRKPPGSTPSLDRRRESSAPEDSSR